MNSVVFGVLLVASVLVATPTATVPGGVPGRLITEAVLPAGVSLLKSAGAPRFGCPLCDSSVYSYCSNKLYHDACCCNGGAGGGGFGCPPTNCNYLHANSCYEHQLIQSCCCKDFYG